MTPQLIASLLYLDRRAIGALRITDPYSLHRVVYSLFADRRSAADKAASTASGIVYADLGGDGRGRRIALLSDRPPLATLDGGYGEVRSRRIAADFLTRDRYRFKVIVNPTRRDSASGKLRPVLGRDGIAAWFAERALASWGFRVVVPALEVDRVDVLRFQEKRQHEVTTAHAHVRGELRVEDRARFENSFACGIGRGRAFGAGLLQLVPLSGAARAVEEGA
jgi:CRISPR system Cascade subunit CasE